MPEELDQATEDQEAVVDEAIEEKVDEESTEVDDVVAEEKQEDAVEGKQGDVEEKQGDVEEKQGDVDDELLVVELDAEEKAEIGAEEVEAETEAEEGIEEKDLVGVVVDDEEEKLVEKDPVEEPVVASGEKEDEEEDERTKLEKQREELLAQVAELNRSLNPAKPEAGNPRAERLARMGYKAEDVADDAILCAIERKMLPNGEPCAFCRGGCAKEANLPGLMEIELQAEADYKGEVVDSGYAPNDDIFVVDVKREDGKTIEAFYTGFGEAAGWVMLDQEVVDAATEGKDALAGRKVISISEAENIALKSLDGVAIAVNPAMFEGYDAYSVEIEGTDGKSYDAYVGLDGTVLGYDEYDSELMDAEDEDPEAKSLEAELELKRAYSMDQRNEMSKNGQALPDGSFPIATVQDLKNAIQAIGRAKDESLAKAHIMKRAVQLDASELIPDNWTSKKKVLVDGETDDTFEKSLMEFQMIETEVDLKDSGLL